jgi:uncharacterized membrane protein
MADTSGGGPPVYARVLVLGGICGLRTMMGPALLGGLAPPGVKLALRLMAAGELIVDKLPTTPNRIAPGPLVGRAVSGAAVGYVVCRQAKITPWLGALLGGMAAVAGAYGGYYGRKALVERLHLPDPLVAVLEDSFAAGLGQRFRP